MDLSKLSKVLLGTAFILLGVSYALGSLHPLMRIILCSVALILSVTAIVLLLISMTRKK